MEEEKKKKIIKFILCGLILITAIILLIIVNIDNTQQNIITTAPKIYVKNVENPISDFVLKNDSIELVDYLNFITHNFVLDEDNYNIYNDNILKSTIIWDNNMDNIINPTDTDNYRLAAQFIYFAEFWLQKLNTNKGFTNVLDMNGIIGKYEFSRNKDVYTGKFNNKVWNWNANRNYCFNTINSKRKNYCMNGWIYNNEKCFPTATSTSKCSSYDWNKMYNYSYDDEINSWMKDCDVKNSSVCIK